MIAAISVSKKENYQSMKLNILDLFAGTGSATEHFRNAGHNVVRIELDESFDAELHADIGLLDPQIIIDRFGSDWDFIWASPPCTSFSVASFRHHWNAISTCALCNGSIRRISGEYWLHEIPNRTCFAQSPRLPLIYAPKSPNGELGLRLLEKTIEIIHYLNPRFYAIENPVGLMRKMPILASENRYTITHCQYGDPRRMKPTDLFGLLPPTFVARACSNRSTCHEAAPRGARTGTQGLNSTEAGMLPPLLGKEICEAIESSLEC